MKHKVYQLKLVLAVIISAVFIASLISDIFLISENPKEYEKVYHFSHDASEWRLRNVDNYINYSIGICCFTFAYLILNILCIFNKGRNLKYLLLTIDLILLIFITIGFMRSLYEGFDH